MSNVLLKIIIIICLILLLISCRPSFLGDGYLYKPDVYIADCSNKDKVKESLIEIFKDDFEYMNDKYELTYENWNWQITETDTTFFVITDWYHDLRVGYDGDYRFLILKSNCHVDYWTYHW